MKNSTSLGYRKDIDGLRAIAVLLVVAFHAFPGVVKGGFIGVDIFFVISGYLISGILAKALATGRFSVTEFYGRRIRRISPALILVLTASIVIGWRILLADELVQLDKHIVGGAAFASNFVFWKESGYFDTSAATKSLLHLWSLGIEEQFYIVWPLLIYSAWRCKVPDGADSGNVLDFLRGANPGQDAIGVRKQHGLGWKALDFLPPKRSPCGNFPAP